MKAAGEWMKRIKRRWYIAVCLLLLIGGYRVEHVEENEPVAQLASDVTSLGIVGYNYTNRAINTFTIDGAGGGNLYVSSPASGGGGTTCCVPYVPGIESV